MHNNAKITQPLCELLPSLISTALTLKVLVATLDALGHFEAG